MIEIGFYAIGRHCLISENAVMLLVKAIADNDSDNRLVFTKLITNVDRPMTIREGCPSKERGR